MVIQLAERLTRNEFRTVFRIALVGQQNSCVISVASILSCLRRQRGVTLMAWTEITRPKYQRDGLRYASDTTDEEWALIEPHIPPASCGRTRETNMREVVNAIFYIAQ